MSDIHTLYAITQSLYSGRARSYHSQRDVPQRDENAERMLGSGQFDLRGQTISSVAQPYRFYLLQRVQDIHDGLAGSEKAIVEAMLQGCGMAKILSTRLDRRLEQADNLEVWL